MSAPLEYILAANEDTYLHSLLVGNNFGDYAYLSCGYLITKASMAFRPLVRISLVTLPEDFRISEAEFWMYCTSAAAAASPCGMHAFEYQSGPLWISPAGAQWVEGEANWNIWSTGNNWSTPGGDHNPTPFATWVLPKTTGDHKLLEGDDLIAYVNELREQAVQFNVCMRREYEAWPSSSATFASRDNGTYAGPRLIVRGACKTVHLVGDTHIVGKASLAGV